MQVASLAAAPDLSTYTTLAPVGEVYTVRAGDRYKIRVGDYATREAALVAAREVQNLGYTGSFVVAAGPPEPTPQATTPTTDPAPATPPTDTDSTLRSPFRVQLGAYAKPENFDRVAATQLGVLGQSKRDALTVFYLDGLQTISQAEAARNRARAAGYVGAYILRLVDGSYVKQ